MAVASVYRPTDHVITNVNDPNIVPDLRSKKPTVYAGTGFGRVPDASTYTMTRSANSIGADVFTQTKLVQSIGCILPPASQAIGQLGNADGNTRGLNLGYVASCSGHFTPGRALNVAEYRPLTKSHFVDTLPFIKNNYVRAGQPILCSNTQGNWEPKREIGRQFSPPPVKTDFLTAVLGPQVSADGSRGRAPKVGAALSRPKYGEKHHGRAWGPRQVYGGFVSPTGAPAQLKINSPMHYPVA